MKINRTQSILSGVLLLLALILTSYFNRASIETDSRAIGDHTSILDWLAHPVDLRAAIAASASNVQAPCPGLFARVAEGTVEDFTSMSDDDRNAIHRCSDALPFLAKHDSSHLNSLRNSCITPDEEGSNAMQGNCGLYFYLYKAALVAHFRKDKSMQELNTVELAHILFHEYNNLDPQRLDILSNYADELALRAPSFSIKKAKASIDFFQTLNAQNPAKIQNLLRTLNDLSFQNPHDEQLLHLHFAALAKVNDVNRMNTLTEDFVKAHPSSATAFFIRSAYFWQKKDRAKTIETLKNAIALEPTSGLYRDTMNRVESAELAAPGVYNINVNFDLLRE